MTPTLREALRARWRALAPRERVLVRAALVLIALAVLWLLLLAPALRTLAQTPARRAALDAQLARMQQLQAQAEQLQAQPRPPVAEALAALQRSAAEQLGASTQLQQAGERVTLTLKDTPAPALAAWLAQVRASTHAAPLELQLQQAPAATPAWSGRLVLRLPPSS